MRIKCVYLSFNYITFELNFVLVLKETEKKTNQSENCVDKIICADWTNLQQEEIEDMKGVIKIRKAKKNRQHNGQTTIYTILHIKLKIE